MPCYLKRFLASLFDSNLAPLKILIRPRKRKLFWIMLRIFKIGRDKEHLWFFVEQLAQAKPIYLLLFLFT